MIATFGSLLGDLLTPALKLDLAKLQPRVQPSGRVANRKTDHTRVPRRKTTRYVDYSIT